MKARLAMQARVALPIVLMAALAGATTLAAPAVGALSPSAYRVGRLCSAPAPGYAGCLGLRLHAKRPLALRGTRMARGARTSPSVSTAPERIEFNEPWEGSLSPQNVLTAYSLSHVSAPASQQTLALVDAFGYPTAAHDLQVFDEQFHLPSCTTANGCFTQIEMNGPGNTPPETNAGWDQETATDIEVAHGMCPSCKILLVEASSNEDSALEAAEREAERLGATEISNSWGGSEQGISSIADDASAFNHPGTVITAAAGDDGYLNWGASVPKERGFADYPASSPHVVAVGGTRLSLNGDGSWAAESVWNGDGAGGGGCSVLTAAPWQQHLAESVGCGADRAVADISADADPYTGVAVYDSTPVLEEGEELVGWVAIGGTSVASPIVASTFALAGGASREANGQTVAYPAQTLYENLTATPGSLHDVTSGSNGKCGKSFDLATGESNCSPAEEGLSCSAKPICLAGGGYDGPTGVGTPNGIAAFLPPGAGTKGEPSSKGGKASGEEGGLANSQPSSAAGAVAPTSGPPATGSLQPGGLRTLVPVLSALALRQTAIAALSHDIRLKVSQLAFAFTLNVAARVRVTLAKQIGAHGHRRWQTLPYTLTLAGKPGRESAHLNALATLTQGRYRLTLAPAHGLARTLTFKLG